MARTRKLPSYRRQLHLESMEDRLTPATFTVTNLNGDYSTGSFLTALINADITDGADTVDFAPGLTGTIPLTNTALVFRDVIIKGPGHDKIAISGGGQHRVFDLTGAPAGTNITIADLTLTGGYAKFVAPGSVVASMGHGGAIAIEDEFVSLTRCNITGNKADRSGGAIQVGHYFDPPSGPSQNAKLTISGCTIANNSALAGNGGAISCYGNFVNGGSATQSLFIHASTLHDNYANWDPPAKDTYRAGGAINWVGKVGSAGFTIANSTIHRNTADNGVLGGALALTELIGKLTVVNCTITDNIAEISDAAGIFKSEEGPNAATVSLSNTILAGNSGANGVYLNDFNSFDPFTANTNNCTIGIEEGNVTFAGLNNATGTVADPESAKVGPLQDNGGQVHTRMPFGVSQNINGGSATYLIGAEDARGPGFPRIMNAIPDRGAVEFHQWVVNASGTSGQNTLAQIIEDSNAVPGPNTITFDVNIFSTPRTIILPQTAMIEGPLTITGPGTAKLTLQGPAGQRILDLRVAAAGDDIALSGINFDAANITSDGAAILANFQDLTIADCSFTNNKALNGAALYMNGTGTLSISRTLFDNNEASFRGGAIGLNKLGSVSISECTFSNNSTTTNTAFDHGGGALHMTGTLANPALIRASTFAHNQAAGNGGAILLSGLGNSVTLQNSTIAFNKTLGSFGGGGIARVGGANGEIYLVSSIVSNNLHDAGTNEDLYSANLIDADFSAIGVTTAAMQMDATTTALVGQNFKLAALADNGGPWKTILPGFASPVRDNGSNPANLALDARGGVRVWNAQADIGAVELPPDFIVGNAASSGKDSLRQAILDANALAGANTVTFDAAFFSTPRTISTAGAEFFISDAFTILGPGAAQVTLDGGGTTRLFSISLGVPATIASVTMKNGMGFGAAVHSVNSTVNLTNVVITGNTAPDPTDVLLKSAVVQFVSTSSPGVILTINNSTITGNSGADAGAILIPSATGSNGGNGSGRLNLHNSNVTGNTSGSIGGAIDVDGTLSIQNSTVANNVTTSKSSAFGGGLTLRNAGISIIRNSTFSGNVARDGGGIAIAYNGSLTIDNTTISGNSAINGGGIFQDDVVLTLRSTIISGNTTNISSNGLDIKSMTPVTLTDSLLGSPSGLTNPAYTGTTASLLGQAALLGPLQDNGGPTLTRLPAPNSPVLGKGSNPSSLGTDQRGIQRIIGGTIDIGAVEIPPGVINLILPDTTISDADVGGTGFFIYAVFNMPMNTATLPTVDFPVEPVVGTLTESERFWLNSTNFGVRYNVADASMTLNGVDVRITGAVEASSGFAAADYDQADVFNIDTANPVASMITSTTPNGSYIVGDAINFTVQFSEPVTLNGTLLVSFNSGGTATIAGPITGTSLSGTYTVGAGQIAADLNVSSIALGVGSTLRDAATNNAVLTPPAGNNLGDNANIRAVGNITAITVNNGDAQRSRLTQVRIDFASPQTIPAIIPGLSFTRTVARPGDVVGTVVNASNGLIVTPASGTASSITLTFSNALTAGINNGSLADGVWRLAMPGLNYTSALNDSNYRRLFGDSDNNGTVNAADFAEFGNAFGGTGAGTAFDFDNNSTVNALDFAEFGNRFGVTL